MPTERCRHQKETKTEDVEEKEEKMKNAESSSSSNYNSPAAPDVNETDRIRLASFVPWAPETWSREASLVAPLTELVAQQHG